jgi:hypothetical protein
MFDRFVRLGAYRPGWVPAVHTALSPFFAVQFVEFRRWGIDQGIERIARLPVAPKAPPRPKRAAGSR